jgi:hypothetical protein
VRGRGATEGERERCGMDNGSGGGVVGTEREMGARDQFKTFVKASGPYRNLLYSPKNMFNTLFLSFLAKKKKKKKKIGLLKQPIFGPFKIALDQLKRLTVNRLIDYQN